MDYENMTIERWKDGERWVVYIKDQEVASFRLNCLTEEEYDQLVLLYELDKAKQNEEFLKLLQHNDTKNREDWILNTYQTLEKYIQELKQRLNLPDLISPSPKASKFSELARFRILYVRVGTAKELKETSAAYWISAYKRSHYNRWDQFIKKVIAQAEEKKMKTKEDGKEGVTKTNFKKLW